MMTGKNLQWKSYRQMKRGYLFNKKGELVTKTNSPLFVVNLCRLEIIAYTHSKHGLIHGLIHVFDDVVFQIQTDRELARGIELTT